MTIAITWSATNGGAAISEPLDHGQGGNGDTLTAQDVYISHNAVNPITLCKFYIGAYSGTYSGNFAAATDLAELLSWGDGGSTDNFGGFQINMDATGSFATSWPVYGTKGAVTDLAVACRTGVGDSAANGIQLNTAMSAEMSVAGTIPNGMTNWPHFKSRIHIPQAEGVVGTRQFDQVMRYTYTT